MTKSHKEFREVVCGVCLRKPKLSQKVTPIVLSLIKKHYWENYCLDDDFFPLIACKSCVATLKTIDKVNISYYNIVIIHTLTI